MANSDVDGRLRDLFTHLQLTTNMTIQWFPGHMHKARLEMEATLPKVHLVIEVLDARIPYSSENPLLSDLRGDKPCIKVLTKSDLADPDMTERWCEALEETPGVVVRAVTTDDVPTIMRLRWLAVKMLPERKGRAINAMICGIPNVGKSTLINYLAGKKVAKTGNTPAVTKQQQRVNIGDSVTLVDTPGMMWPNVHNVNSGYRLALLGSIKETAMDYADIGFFAARYLIANYPDRLVDRYDLDEVPTAEMEAIEAIGRKRGCLGKNGMVDIDRASRILVTELRSGGLGRLTIETPESMRRERAETARIVAEKEETAKEKDAKRKKRFRDKQRAQRKSREMG
ncbi:Ribosome biogenesis GTPase A [Rubripirellula tenax]|uniref:Ribosome biogenesis GTPase A n=1 Tax=Rubripirellula tenax TaxID=2528015 RepID=A0A5C6FJ90_9BACT|nr:ribosome biogenesis GTPase YlqF [Rubripirellula tenax]TWU60157.1 Ribosome biogenesis GTPase A [Rubripirellula tenax]